MTTNGNGKSQAPAAVVTAQTQVHELERSLIKLKDDIAAAEQKVKAAELQLETAAKAAKAAKDAWMDDDSKTNRERHIEAGNAEKLAQDKVAGLKDRLAKLEAQKPARDTPYQQACVRLTLAMRDWRKEQVETELYAAKFRLAQAQQDVLEAQHKVNELADERRRIVASEDKERQAAMTPFAYGGPRGQVVTR